MVNYMVNNTKKLSSLLLITLFVASCSTNFQSNVQTENFSSFSSDTGSDSYKIIEEYTKSGFGQVDQNHDGLVSKTEMSYAPKSFEKMDADHDGNISFNEALASNKDVMLKMASDLDKMYIELFNSIDTDKNNLVSWNDISNNTFSLSLSSTDKIKFESLASKSLLDFNGFKNFLSSIFSNEIKEQGKNNLAVKSGSKYIIMTPGYGEPGFVMTVALKNITKKLGIQSYAMSGFPHFGDIREEAQAVKIKSVEIFQKTGNRVDVIGHSQGGLIGRYYVKFLGGSELGERYISVATPHHGTYVAYAGIGEAAEQMRYNSDFIKELNKGDETPGNIKYTSIWTNTDVIVVPSSSCILEGANNLMFKNGTHHLLILRKEVQQSIEKALAQ